MDVKRDASSQPADINPVLVAERPSKRPLPPLGKHLVAGIAFVVALATIGAAFAPYLAVKHPLLLVALNPWPRHVILVAPHVPVFWLVLVVSVRGLLSCIISFEVGRHYGPQGLELFERKSPRLAGFVRAFERMFLKAAPAFLLLAPGPLTSTLSAVSGSSRLWTWLLSWLGLAAWAVVNYHVGDWLKPWTQPILQFVSKHLVETTVGCAVLVFGYQVIARRRRLKQIP